VSDVPVRIDAAERALEGTRLDDSSIADVATLTAETIDPPDDMHASAAHRRRLAAALVKRALREAHQRATG
jgi:carbon-monoxide dehydrogenase medium subunit